MNTENQPQEPVQDDSTASDTAGVVIMTTIKIVDPDTGKVLLRMRGDE